MSRPIDTTRGPLLSALVRLAAPVVVMQLCHTLYHWVDVMWVGRLGATATAAVSTSFFAVWTLWALADVVGVGVAATVSRHVGAGERDRAGYASAQAFWLAILLGVAVTVIGVPLVPALFRALGTSPEVAVAGTSYLRIVISGAIFSMLYVLGESILRAAGDTRTPMIVIAVSLVLNALLDPLLIFGWGPVPAFGTDGAAIATVAAQGFAVAWFARLAWRAHPGMPFRIDALRTPSASYQLALARIGAPFALIGVLYSIVYLGLARTAAGFGTPALAVVGIANRIESMSYLVAAGFGLACEAIVGQNLGAGLPARAERATWLSVRLMCSLGFVVALFMWFLPEALLSFFTADPEVIARGVPYLRILAPCQAFTCLEMVLNGAFAGAGDTLPPSVISVTVSLLRMPLAPFFAFALGLGLDGIAWTITLTCMARALIVLAWFRRGRWKTKRPATVAHPLPAADVTH